MTVSKVTVSLDPAGVDRARREAAAGRAPSLSSWLNEAALAHAEREDLESVLSDLLDETGGPLTGRETAAVEDRLGTSRAPMKLVVDAGALSAIERADRRTVLAFRFDTSEIGGIGTEICAYGTAVRSAS